MSKEPAKKTRQFCEAYIRTMDLRKAAAEARLTEREALDLLAEPEVGRELERCRSLLAGQICPEDAVRRMANLAFGAANDCVKLVLQEDADIGSLDLGLLSELKKGANGVVEIKLLDRLKVLDRLLELLGGGNQEADSFFKALDEAEPE